MMTSLGHAHYTAARTQLISDTERVLAVQLSPSSPHCDRESRDSRAVVPGARVTEHRS